MLSPFRRPIGVLDRQPAIRGCPLCGVSMFACKSDGDSSVYDTFQCPRCACVITSAAHRLVRDERADINRTP